MKEFIKNWWYVVVCVVALIIYIFMLRNCQSAENWLAPEPYNLDRLEKKIDEIDKRLKRLEDDGR